MVVPFCKLPDFEWPQTILFEGVGTALIIGANTGYAVGFPDPSFGILTSSLGNHLDKVFVEPMPPLFRRLVRNLVGVPRAFAVQAAVVWPGRLNESRSLEANGGSEIDGDADLGTVSMFCVGVSGGGGNGGGEEGSETERLASRDKSGELGLDEGPLFTAEAAAFGGSPLWLQTCSLDRQRLFKLYDMASNGEVPAHLVTETQVPRITIDGLLRHHIKSPVRYVQIDVEGFDDYVLRQLPLRDKNFQPILIVFEFALLGQARLIAALRYLTDFGYQVCLMEDKQNMVAVQPREFFRRANRILNFLSGREHHTAAAVASEMVRGGLRAEPKAGSGAQGAVNASRRVRK
eukprot:TRINITY_DN54607_c0_g1_i1.p1 TRINITY_DN54607_c0_g1~~TRINITY_DN54607_c0_g1_i1.p1  ORF type:complete len:347 (+),score=59.38 TRINITY_DN54607_c0_g1_i1:151-1191(+)